MSNSSSTIKMNYDKAMKQADKLDQLARDLKQTAGTTLDNCLANISSAWKSDASDKYIKQGRRLEEDLKLKSEELRKSASVVRTIANNIYKAEMQALQTAEGTYK